MSNDANDLRALNRRDCLVQHTRVQTDIADVWTKGHTNALVFNSLFLLFLLLGLETSYMVDRFTEISPFSAMI